MLHTKFNDCNEALAFSNPEYMCFSEIKNIIQQPTLTKTTASTTQRRRGHRAVPLPPPARPPPPPPTTLPPVLPPKLYQNLPIVSEQIHIECYSQQTAVNNFNSNLLKIQDSTTSFQDSTCGSSMIILSSNNTVSDSSTATMIVKSSPEKEPTRSMISPIMPSSRADLHRQQFSYPIDIDSTPFQPNSTRNNNQQITHSLPFKRVANHQRQRKLSFNETMEIIEQLTEPTNNTRTQKSFSNFNYELHTKSQESLVASSDSLSASSSLSSLVLQPPSPFKTSILEMNKQTPSKSNIKSSTLQRKQAKKVSFMLREEEAALNTSDYDCAETLILHNDQSISPNSSMSSLDFHSDKIIFANHDYFLNLHNNMEPSSSSSSSASSTCSSSSSTSSGYKSINVSSKLSPPDLNFFIQSNQDRLERLRQKRAELLMARNTNKLTEILDYEETRSSEHVSGKFFRSPALNTLPRRSVPKNTVTML